MPLLLFSVFRTHCQSTVTHLGKMRIKLIPALADNYMYLLIDDKTNSCALVDPVKPDDVRNLLIFTPT